MNTLRALILALASASLLHAGEPGAVDIYWNADDDANLYINGASVIGTEVNPKPGMGGVFKATVPLKPGDVVAFSACDTFTNNQHVVAVFISGDNILFETREGQWEGTESFPSEAWFKGKEKGYPVEAAKHPYKVYLLHFYASTGTFPESSTPLWGKSRIFYMRHVVTVEDLRVKQTP